MLAWVAQPAPVPPALLATGVTWSASPLAAAAGGLVGEMRRWLLESLRGLAAGARRVVTAEEPIPESRPTRLSDTPPAGARPGCAVLMAPRVGLG